MRRKYIIFTITTISAAFLLLYACTQGQRPNSVTVPETENSTILHKSETTVATRFSPPEGYKRNDDASNSFASYLQNLSLKPDGTDVQYYDGRTKPHKVAAAVLDVSVGNKDLQQCADALIRLRAEYLFSLKRYDEISFALTNGFDVPFSRWRTGSRVIVNGNTCGWKQSATASSTHETLLQYLEFVYSYAGTLSLSKSLKPLAISDMQAGDVFVQGGSPGHAIIVIDMATNEAGEKLFMLAQSYMPAQDIHILINQYSSAISPWYKLPGNGMLETPEWTFKTSGLKRW